LRQVLANNRQHRSVGELKEEHASSEDVEIAVFPEVKDAMVTLGLLALPRISGAGIVDFVGANPAQRNECRDAQRGSTKEYSAFRKILTGQSHQPRG
jgi:hypothetical protein